MISSRTKSLIYCLKVFFKRNNKRKAVIGISGGVDSALVAALAARALGAKNVIGVILPSNATPSADLADARLLAKGLGIKKIFEFGISPSASKVKRSLSSAGISLSKVGDGNISARIRMICLYAIAGENNALVLGTGDKTELALGYFTKFGDGGCDVLPIGSLLKTEVRQMARELGVPEKIASKPSSPGLWKGQFAEKELGAKYEEVDALLSGKSSILSGSKKARLSKFIAQRKKMSEHKRKLPPIL